MLSGIPTIISTKLKSKFYLIIHNIRTGAQSEIFKGKGGFVELEHFDNHFVKNITKKGPAEKQMEFFLLGNLKTTFSMENLTQRWSQSGHFFPKLEHSFGFS